MPVKGGRNSLIELKRMKEAHGSKVLWGKKGGVKRFGGKMA